MGQSSFFIESVKKFPLALFYTGGIWDLPIFQKMLIY